MSNRKIQRGSDLMAFLRDGIEGAYTYRAIAGQTGVSFDPQVADYLESQAKNLNGWTKRFPSGKDWTASVEMDVTDELDVDANEVDYNELADASQAGTLLDWVFAWVTEGATPEDAVVIDTTRRMWYGQGFVNLPLSGPARDKVTTTATITPSLALTAIDPA
ncbi:hypothetical protein [Sunxiuqinia indica]|uniref:hypothetical protein n=1 Tax=Sunxiuqinia indica TaxID=2692584 RepID=UPI001357EB2B|nr:hypothetical protein [Sunxiuqinia indica]